MIKKRNIVTAYILTFVTFGIYGIYWMVQQKKEINSLGAEIPTAWLLILPIANLYWAYKFCEGYSQVVKKDDNTIMWFLIYLIAGFVIPGIFQDSLNKLPEAEDPAAPIEI